jgi:hypothetical protein
MALTEMSDQLRLPRWLDGFVQKVEAQIPNELAQFDRWEHGEVVESLLTGSLVFSTCQSVSLVRYWEEVCP